MSASTKMSLSSLSLYPSIEGKHISTPAENYIFSVLSFLPSLGSNSPSSFPHRFVWKALRALTTKHSPSPTQNPPTPTYLLAFWRLCGKGYAGRPRGTSVSYETVPMKTILTVGLKFHKTETKILFLY